MFVCVGGLCMAQHLQRPAAQPASRAHALAPPRGARSARSALENSTPPRARRAQMCQVCDAAEAARNVHADGPWRAAAGAACRALSSYLAAINQHEGMYVALRDTMERCAGARQGRVCLE